MQLYLPKEQQESFEKYKEDYIGHWYDGTFFINMTVDENYGRAFITLYYDHDLEKEEIDYMKQIGYENFVNSVIEFNSYPIQYEDIIQEVYLLQKKLI